MLCKYLCARLISYTHYTYDAENRLRTADNPEHANIEYIYDPLGRRISRTVDGETTYFVYDGGQVICEYDSNEKLRRKFLYGAGIDEVVRMSQVRKTADISGPPPTGEPDGEVNIHDLHAMAAAWLNYSANHDADLNYDGKINNTDSDILSANWLTDGLDCEEHYYYHYDGLGSVVALSGENGSVLERYEYDVYGNTVIESVGQKPRIASHFGNPYMFTGRRLDTETGLYYYRARMYSASLGRFLQVDPIGYADSMNLYIYVGNNPIIFVDPYGLCGENSWSSRHWTPFSSLDESLITGSYSPVQPGPKLPKWKPIPLPKFPTPDKWDPKNPPPWDEWWEDDPAKPGPWPEIPDKDRKGPTPPIRKVLPLSPPPPIIKPPMSLPPIFFFVPRFFLPGFDPYEGEPKHKHIA